MTSSVTVVKQHLQKSTTNVTYQLFGRGENRNSACGGGFDTLLTENFPGYIFQCASKIISFSISTIIDEDSNKS